MNRKSSSRRRHQPLPESQILRHRAADRGPTVTDAFHGDIMSSRTQLLPRHEVLAVDLRVLGLCFLDD